MFQSVEELTEYFNTLDKVAEYQVGPICAHQSRAIYQIGNAQILMDQVVPYNWFKSTRIWYWTNYSMTTKQAEADAIKYNARVEEEYYPEDGVDSKQLIFDDCDDLLQWLFDNKLSDLTPTEYKITLSMKDGSKFDMVREGCDMESTLKQAKIEAKKYPEWTGGIVIHKKQ